MRRCAGEVGVAPPGAPTSPRVLPTPACGHVLRRALPSPSLTPSTRLGVAPAR